MLEYIEVQIKPFAQYENGQNPCHWAILNFQVFERPSGRRIGNLFNYRIPNMPAYETEEEAREAARLYLDSQRDQISLNTLAQTFGN